MNSLHTSGGLCRLCLEVFTDETQSMAVLDAPPKTALNQNYVMRICSFKLEKEASGFNLKFHILYCSTLMGTMIGYHVNDNHDYSYDRL